jgi:hypothetical protein
LSTNKEAATNERPNDDLTEDKNDTEEENSEEKTDYIVKKNAEPDNDNILLDNLLEEPAPVGKPMNFLQNEGVAQRIPEDRPPMRAEDSGHSAEDQEPLDDVGAQYPSVDDHWDDLGFLASEDLRFKRQLNSNNPGHRDDDLEDLFDVADLGDVIQCPYGTIYCLERQICASSCGVMIGDEEDDEQHDDDDSGDVDDTSRGAGGGIVTCPSGQIYCVSARTCDSDCRKYKAHDFYDDDKREELERLTGDTCRTSKLSKRNLNDEDADDEDDFYRQGKAIQCPIGQLYCLQTEQCARNCGLKQNKRPDKEGDGIGKEDDDDDDDSDKEEEEDDDDDDDGEEEDDDDDEEEEDDDDNDEGDCSHGQVYCAAVRKIRPFTG